MLRQGLAIRGHKESEGNFIQLLSNNCPELKQWLLSNQYLSHDIMNELITLMGNTMLRQLVTNIRAVRWFSVLADKTRGISSNEQLAILIRWVDMRRKFSVQLTKYTCAVMLHVHVYRFKVTAYTAA